MTTGQHNRSYWNAMAAPASLPGLAVDLKADIAVIGGLPRWVHG
ncbi:MAG: hypothetical protein WC247_12940 [Porticoccaceae bacterium]|jgi:hypothetical protein